MQVLVFVGESFYPRAHLQDLVGTLASQPSYDDVVRIIRAEMAPDVRYSRLTTGQADWVTTLALEPGQPPRRQAWTVVHRSSPKALHAEGCYRVWQDAESDEWHGLRDADDLDPLQVSLL